MEDVVPPGEPWHVVLQQLLALLLEHGALPAVELAARVTAEFPELAEGKLKELMQHLEATEILYREDGMLQLGREGERQFGRRNFVDLTSVFMSSPDFRVLHGRAEIGYVAPAVLVPQGHEAITMSLAGHAWRVTSVDWRRRQAWVEPADSAAATRWGARGRALGYPLVQAVRRVLHDGKVGGRLSRRGEACLEAECERLAFLGEPGRVVAVAEGHGVRLWTFGGVRANLALVKALAAGGCGGGKWDDFGLAVARTSVEELRVLMSGLAETMTDGGLGASTIEAGDADDVKFSNALPGRLRCEIVEQRLVDRQAAQKVCSLPIVQVEPGGGGVGSKIQ